MNWILRITRCGVAAIAVVALSCGETSRRPDGRAQPDGGAADERRLDAGGLEPTDAGAPASTGSDAGTQPSGRASLPEFISVIRPYIGVDYDDFQIATIKELGFQFVQGLVDFSWGNLQRAATTWKWAATDSQMDKLAANGLRVIGFIICPKRAGLPWDDGVVRTDPRYRAAYERFAFEVVNRYHAHPAWSGIVAVWGGSADIWDQQVSLTDPEVVVPLLNAAYDGVKRADPTTIVVGFNFATPAHPTAVWEEYHRRAFAVRPAPRFDWYGLQTHGVPPTMLQRSDSYGGVQGITNVRRFLDANGFADKPIWQNEAGFMFGVDMPGGIPEDDHAENEVLNFVVSRSLDVNLKGWIQFELFAKDRLVEDFGVMESLDRTPAGQNPRPRKAWTALKTLLSTLRFDDYRFEAKLSGEPSHVVPAWVLRFAHRTRAGAKLFVVFSPRDGEKDGPQGPVNQEVTIDIAPATRGTLFDIVGNQTPATADSTGAIRLTSTASPVYLVVEP